MKAGEQSHSGDARFVQGRRHSTRHPRLDLSHRIEQRPDVFALGLVVTAPPLISPGRTDENEESEEERERHGCNPNELTAERLMRTLEHPEAMPHLRRCSKLAQ